MANFDTKRLSPARDVIAPDGSDVRILLRLDRGSLAHFELAPGATSIAVCHRTVDEIWFILSGRGEMWRKQGAHEQVVPLDAGVSLTIPVGTHFQFRTTSRDPLAAIAVTMPPWPDEREAFEVPGKWKPSASRE